MLRAKNDFPGGGRYSHGDPVRVIATVVRTEPQVLQRFTNFVRSPSDRRIGYS